MKAYARDLWVTAQTIWGEARGEPIAGQRAVAHVIRNRCLKRTMNPAQVCLQAQQFSCWNFDDPNHDKLLTVDLLDPAFRRALCVAIDILSGLRPDPTYGATHYHALQITPYWAEGKTPCFRVGNHLFYNSID